MYGLKQVSPGPGLEIPGLKGKNRCYVICYNKNFLLEVFLHRARYSSMKLHSQITVLIIFFIMQL